MAEKTDKSKKEKSKQDNAEKEKAEKIKQQEERGETLVRIKGYDIPGSKNVYAGLTRIKGVSWAVSHAVCSKLNIPRLKKIAELTKDDCGKIELFLKTLPIADFLKNRRSDIETGETKHYFGSDLDIKKEFDIKRLKEIRSYRGMRHAAKLPVRGQRTRSHFRTHGVTMGMKRKKT